MKHQQIDSDDYGGDLMDETLNAVQRTLSKVEMIGSPATQEIAEEEMTTYTSWKGKERAIIDPSEIKYGPPLSAVSSLSLVVSTVVQPRYDREHQSKPPLGWTPFWVPFVSVGPQLTDTPPIISKPPRDDRRGNRSNPASARWRSLQQYLGTLCGRASEIIKSRPLRRKNSGSPHAEMDHIVDELKDTLGLIVHESFHEIPAESTSEEGQLYKITPNDLGNITPVEPATSTKKSKNWNKIFVFNLGKGNKNSRLTRKSNERGSSSFASPTTNSIVVEKPTESLPKDATTVVEKPRHDSGYSAGGGLPQYGCTPSSAPADDQVSRY